MVIDGRSFNHFVDTMPQPLVYISVGSNLGPKVENCRQGISALTSGNDVNLVATSLFYRTAPVDFLDQDWFVNAVVSIHTSLSPAALLQRLQVIQKMAGRGKKTIRFGPRVLDLDILLFGDLIIATPDLVVPHPRMHKRRFVLQPLCDINPHLIHPIINKRVGDLLRNLNEDDQPVVPIDG